MRKISLTHALIICAFTLGATGVGPPLVPSATAANIEAKRVRLTQAGFDRLIEQLAQQDLRNVWTIGQAVGVDFSGTQLPASPGWIDYF
jgi:hypothetical protein